MSEHEDKYKEYLETLNEKEKIALSIAKRMLETSFDIEKSIGYLNWKKTREDNKKI
tara:strand:+ start:778 stop:945 length:168 start_codon:yes stop_codon:yes gene_type:complete